MNKLIITDEEIKEDFLCPLCGVNKEYFEEIIVLDEEEKPKSIPIDEDNPSIQRIVKRCINCGRCVEVCASRLIPSRLADYAEHHDEEAFTKHEGLECMECGSCSYVCPAKRPLTQVIKSMRKMQLAKKKKK